MFPKLHSAYVDLNGAFYPQVFAPLPRDSHPGYLLLSEELGEKALAALRHYNYYDVPPKPALEEAPLRYSHGLFLDSLAKICDYVGESASPRARENEKLLAICYGLPVYAEIPPGPVMVSGKKCRLPGLSFALCYVEDVD